MILHNALAYCGLAAALVLLATSQSRGLALVAVAAAAVQVLTHLQFISLQVAHLPLGPVLGLLLAVPSLVAWFRSSTKTAITAGAVAAFVGILQVVGYALPRL